MEPHQKFHGSVLEGVGLQIDLGTALAQEIELVVGVRGVSRFGGGSFGTRIGRLLVLRFSVGCGFGWWIEVGLRFCWD
jgi:hypothetical protein